MPRRLRHTLQGTAFHVINRAVRCARIFETAGDYQAFLKVAQDGLARYPVRVIAYCVMPTHWHFVVLVRSDSAGLTVDALARRNARRAVARGPRNPWNWPSLSGSIQGRPDSDRDVAAASVPLRRAKCPARGPGSTPQKTGSGAVSTPAAEIAIPSRWNHGQF